MKIKSILKTIESVFGNVRPEESVALSGDEKVLLVIVLSLFALFIITCIVTGVINHRLDKKYERERVEAKKRYDEARRMFHVEFSMLREEDMKYLSKQANCFILLSEPVAENYYHHRLSTGNPLEWGVYVGSYFLRCDCDEQTFRCVKLLREKGVSIKRDLNCVYEKE